MVDLMFYMPYKILQVVVCMVLRTIDLIMLACTSDGTDAYIEIVQSQTYQTQVEQTLNEYGDSLLRLAYSYMKNLSDAEDILQDVMIIYYKEKKVFESNEHKKAWLIRVTINECKTKLRRQKIRKAEPLDDNIIVNVQDNLKFVWSAVQSLPVKYREIIHLYYQEGFAVSEISSILHKNESTIRSLLKRGREKLKIILKEEYDFEQ